MSRRYLAFDIETAKVLPEHVTNVLDHRPLGICCAAAVAVDRPGARIWHGLTSQGTPSAVMSRTEAQALVNDLRSLIDKGYTLVTWNGLDFDFNVLAEESGLSSACADLALGHVDMMFHIVCALGYFIKLDKVAQAMALSGKAAGMTGFRAPILWAQGHHSEVIQYCVQDVRTTLEVAAACEQRRLLQWLTRKGTVGSLPGCAARKVGQYAAQEMGHLRDLHSTCSEPNDR